MGSMMDDFGVEARHGENTPPKKKPWTREEDTLIAAALLVCLLPTMPALLQWGEGGFLPFGGKSVSGSMTGSKTTIQLDPPKDTPIDIQVDTKPEDRDLEKRFPGCDVVLRFEIPSGGLLEVWCPDRTAPHGERYVAALNYGIKSKRVP